MGYEKIIKELEQYVETRLSDKRRRHTFGVRDAAVELSDKYSADKEKACVAARAHEMYRG